MVILEREIIEQSKEEFKGPSIGTHKSAYQLLNQLLEQSLGGRGRNYLPRWQIRELESERRGRKSEIRCLQEKLTVVSQDERGELVRQLQDLSAHQFATRMFRKMKE